MIARDDRSYVAHLEDPRVLGRLEILVKPDERGNEEKDADLPATRGSLRLNGRAVNVLRRVNRRGTAGAAACMQIMARVYRVVAPGAIFAADEVDLVGPVRIRRCASLRRHVAHRVSAATVARVVGLGAVYSSRHRGSGTRPPRASRSTASSSASGPSGFGVEDVTLATHFNVLIDPRRQLPVRAGNYPHAAVLHARFVHRQP